MRKVGALVFREREFDDAMLRRTRRPPDSTVPPADEHETRLGTVIARKYHPSSDRTNNQDPANVLAVSAERLRPFAKQNPTRFDISWSAMRAAIRESRDDLATGRLRHVAQADDVRNLGLCFNMGIHRTEAGDHRIVGLIGLDELKLGLEPTGMIDVMPDAPDNSLWDLFYPDHFSPADIERVTPQDAVLAINRWFAKSSDVWIK
jgi:hypothetical protein